MKCKFCNVDMGLSKALDSWRGCTRALVATYVIHKHPVPLVDCYKCPKCGCSVHINTKK